MWIEQDIVWRIHTEIVLVLMSLVMLQLCTLSFLPAYGMFCCKYIQIQYITYWLINKILAIHTCCALLLLLLFKPNVNWRIPSAWQNTAGADNILSCAQLQHSDLILLSQILYLTANKIRPNRKDIPLYILHTHISLAGIKTVFFDGVHVVYRTLVKTSILFPVSFQPLAQTSNASKSNL